MFCMAMRRIAKIVEGCRFVLTNGQQRPKKGISDEWQRDEEKLPHRIIRPIITMKQLPQTTVTICDGFMPWKSGKTASLKKSNCLKE
jgi:hypothetical protein